MSCHGCNPSILCPDQNDTLFPYTLTALSPFQFIVICPTNSDCTAAISVTMNCCGTPVTIQIPTGASDAERAALVQQLIAQCRLQQEECGGGGGGGSEVPPTTQYYFNQARISQVPCSSTYGGVYNWPVAAGEFVAETQAEANALADSSGEATALENRFCLNAPCLCPCANIATIININPVGGTGPFTLEITSGSAPTGMSLAFVGNILKLTGTPSVTGTSSMTIKVTDDLGGYLTKSLTFYVLKISTTSLPNAEEGTPYSQQIVGTGGTGNYTFSIVSGSLPSGLSMTTGGLIAGTPTDNTPASFTVRMRDAGIPQTTGGCTQALTIEFAPPASMIIYYRLDGTGAWFAPAAPLGSVIAPDVSTVPGGKHMLEQSTGGVPKVLPGLITNCLQGGTVDPNPVGSTFPDGQCGGYWNYFPRLAAGLSNKFTMRFWFRIDPYIIAQLGFSSIGFTMIELESGQVSVACDDAPNVFQVTMRWFNGGSVSMLSPEIPLDSNWHRVLVMYDPDTDAASLQIDNGTPATAVIANVLPTDGKNGIKWRPASAGIVQPSPDDSTLTLIEMNEFYIADDYIWSTGQSTSDFNAGVGKTWPNVPGV